MRTMPQKALTPNLVVGEGWDPFQDRKDLAQHGFTAYTLSPGDTRFLPGHASVVRPFAPREQQLPRTGEADDAPADHDGVGMRGPHGGEG